MRDSHLQPRVKSNPRYEQGERNIIYECSELICLYSSSFSTINNNINTLVNTGVMLPSETRSSVIASIRGAMDVPVHSIPQPAARRVFKGDTSYTAVN